jgi:hypothetical protein
MSERGGGSSSGGNTMEDPPDWHSEDSEEEVMITDPLEDAYRLQIERSSIPPSLRKAVVVLRYHWNGQPTTIFLLGTAHFSVSAMISPNTHPPV